MFGSKLKILPNVDFNIFCHNSPLFRKKKDEDDPRDEVKCSCGLCFGIGGSITIGAAMVIILILYLACMLEVNSSDNEK